MTQVIYQGNVWNVETIFFGRNGSDNPRIRIGRTDEAGNYYWELVFKKEVKEM